MTSVLVLALIITLVLHLVEEINKDFRHRLPLGTMPKPVFVGINVSVYSFCLITLFFSLTDNAMAVPFALVLAFGMLLNGLGHVVIMAVRRRYFPGGITSFLLASVAILLIVHLLKLITVP